MAKRFENKVVLITGGGSGIGLAAAHRLSEEGAKVAIVGRTKDKLEKAADEVRSKSKGEVFVIAGDMSDEGDVKAAVSKTVETCGRLDCVFLNAGLGYTEEFSKASAESYNKVFDVNTKGVLFGINAAAKAMKEQGVKGSILVTASVLGHAARASMPVMGLYAASKAAAEMFVKYAAIEYADAGIRVNAISPGVVWTTIMDQSEAEADEMAKPLQLMERAGRAREVASLVAFMLSDEGSLVTGSNYDIDGGWMLKA